MSRHMFSVFHFGAISLLMILLEEIIKIHYTRDELQLMSPPNFKSLKYRLRNSDLINSTCSDSILIQ